MKFEVRKRFPINSEELFGYFVYSNDCNKWMEYEDWNGLTLLLKDGTYSGFEIPNPDPRMKALTFEVDDFVKNEQVVYKPSQASPENVHADTKTLFPFKEMKQALYFRPLESGSEVLHIIELVPRGIIGWFTCKFIVKPHILSGLNKSNQRLEQHLNA